MISTSRYLARRYTASVVTPLGARSGELQFVPSERDRGLLLRPCFALNRGVDDATDSNLGPPN